MSAAAVLTDPTPVTLRRCLIPWPASPAARPEIGGRPFPYWPMREMQRWGVEEFWLLGTPDGTGTETGIDPALPDRLARRLPRPATIRIAPPDLAAPERALLCPGHAIAEGDLSPFLRAAADAPPGTGVALAAPSAPGAHPAPALLALPAGVPAIAAAIDHLARTGHLLRHAAPGAVHRLDRPLPHVPAPLRRPALFLDRDGVINRDHGYVGDRDRFEWTPDGRAAIRAATAAGHHVFVVTNQSGIARGFYDEAALDTLHRWMIEAIRHQGGTIDDLRFCPFHPDAPLPRYRRDSLDRKPGPGMILDLLRAWELDPARCALIGDQPSDLAAATAAGIAGRLSRGNDLLPILAGLGIPTDPAVDGRGPSADRDGAAPATHPGFSAR